MKKITEATVIKNNRITNNIFDMTINAPTIAEEAIVGQFVEIYTGNAAHILPRPISLCEIDKVNGNLRVVYQVVGKGTDIFSKLKGGDKVKVLGSCGNGFEKVEDNEAVNIIVGGGIGVPPMLELTKQLKGKKIVILGFRNKDMVILTEEFQKYADEVYVTTDDGSEGYKGNVVGLMAEKGIRGDMIYSCGPKIMLKFLNQYAEKNNIKCQVSMEERMACGIGACVGCIIKIKDNNEEGWSYRKVCKDGPVFDGSEVIWE